MITARLVPHRLDDLRPRALPHVGKVYSWRLLWTMDEEDPFPGEGAYEPVLANRKDWFGWVPDRDLEAI